MNSGRLSSCTWDALSWTAAWHSECVFPTSRRTRCAAREYHCGRGQRGGWARACVADVPSRQWISSAFRCDLDVAVGR